jgi:hypothetical protein
VVVGGRKKKINKNSEKAAQATNNTKQKDYYTALFLGTSSFCMMDDGVSVLFLII